jgi:hypothetical protein
MGPRGSVELEPIDVRAPASAGASPMDQPAGSRELPAPVTPGTGAKPEWLVRLQQGNEFNRAHSFDYPYRELYIEDPRATDGYVKVDAYDDVKQEIISRKNTQFANIDVDTGRAYVRELVAKYPPGSKIADVPSSGPLAGQRLQGTMILEVPMQSAPIPPPVLQEAVKSGITIRDVYGNLY